MYIGADCAAVSGNSLRTRSDPKVFRNGDFLMGFTSSFRMGQLLRYAFTPPDKWPTKDLYEYMVTDFVNGIRSCLKGGGYARTESGEESGGTFLVGFQKRLFVISDDYQVSEWALPYAAVGCGAPYALGSLYATEGESPEDRVRIALEAAEKFSIGVSSPFTIEVLGEGQGD